MSAITNYPIKNITIDGYILPTPKENEKNKVISFFKKGWDYRDSVIDFASSTITTLVETKKWVSNSTKLTLEKTVFNLGFVSVLNLPKKLCSIPSKIQKIWRNIQWKDHEGAVLAALSFSLFIGNVFDALTSLANKILQTLAQNKISWISAMGLPLGLSLIGLDMALDSRRLFKLEKFRREFNREVIKKTHTIATSTESLKNIVKTYMEKYIGIDPEGNISLMQSKILKRRATTSKVVTQFKIIANLLKETHLSPEKEREMLMRLKAIEKLIEREVKFKTISLVSTAVTSVAVSLFLHPPAALVSWTLLTLSAGIGLGVQVYKDWKDI